MHDAAMFTTLQGARRRLSMSTVHVAKGLEDFMFGSLATVRVALCVAVPSVAESA